MQRPKQTCCLHLWGGGGVLLPFGASREEEEGCNNNNNDQLNGPHPTRYDVTCADPSLFCFPASLGLTAETSVTTNGDAKRSTRRGSRQQQIEKLASFSVNTCKQSGNTRPATHGETGYACFWGRKGAAMFNSGSIQWVKVEKQRQRGVFLGDIIQSVRLIVG